MLTHKMSAAKTRHFVSRLRKPSNTAVYWTSMRI